MCQHQHGGGQRRGRTSRRNSMSGAPSYVTCSIQPTICMKPAQRTKRPTTDHISGWTHLHIRTPRQRLGRDGASCAAVRTKTPATDTSPSVKSSEVHLDLLCRIPTRGQWQSDRVTAALSIGLTGCDTPAAAAVCCKDTACCRVRLFQAGIDWRGGGWVLQGHRQQRGGWVCVEFNTTRVTVGCVSINR